MIFTLRDNVSVINLVHTGCEPGTKISINNSMMNKLPDPHTLKHGIH